MALSIWQFLLDFCGLFMRPRGCIYIFGHFSVCPYLYNANWKLLPFLFFLSTYHHRYTELLESTSNTNLR